VGDVNLGDATATAIRSYGSNYPWTSAAPVLRAADLAVANLECAVSTRGTPAAKLYTFRGDPPAVAGLQRAGIDVVSLANNHSLDYGVEAFVDTVRHLRRAGVSVAGGGRDLAAARKPAIVEAGGLRLAIFGYSDVRPAGFDASEDRPGAARAEIGAITTDIRNARRRGETVVVYFHWGTERAQTPDARQRSFATAALDAGATVVLGAHPHVLQPVELSGRRLLAWSLGNFVFAAHSPETSTTGVLTAGLDARGVRWSDLIPATISGVRPLLREERKRQALRRIAAPKSL
jgi:poly-gamma-glutamate synthesis protein (capsule biosynthesis protein)